MEEFSRQSGVDGTAIRDGKDWEGLIGRNGPERANGDAGVGRGAGGLRCRTAPEEC